MAFALMTDAFLSTLSVGELSKDGDLAVLAVALAVEATPKPCLLDLAALVDFLRLQLD
jgi:hypothetical protein